MAANPAHVYDQCYFDRFTQQADSDIGRKLMQFRVQLVERHTRSEVVDVGIGSGAFVDLRNKRGHPTYGYDINPAGAQWLRERGAFLNPYQIEVQTVTLWDVLEHILDFPRLLQNVTEWAFISVPIFKDAEHVLRSKHFRPTEHFWYFTEKGLEYAMDLCDFKLVHSNDMETQLGREDIGTFVFRRA